MIDASVKFSTETRLKHIKYDDNGRSIIHGYNMIVTTNPVNASNALSFRLISFTHPGEYEIILNEKQIRMRYDIWSEQDDEERKPKSEREFVSEQKESSWHCIFCGGGLTYWAHNKGNVPYYLNCKKCGVSFEAHGAQEENRQKGPGDSFSITYWQ